MNWIKKFLFGEQQKQEQKTLTNKNGIQWSAQKKEQKTITQPFSQIRKRQQQQEQERKYYYPQIKEQRQIMNQSTRNNMQLYKYKQRYQEDRYQQRQQEDRYSTKMQRHKNKQMKQFSYKKEDAIPYFRTKVQDEQQPSLNESQCSQYLKKSLKSAPENGLLVRGKQCQEVSLKRPKKMNRKVAVQFQCKKCSTLSQSKKWISILGNMEISFQMNKYYMNQQLKYGNENDYHQVSWSMKLYKQKCLKCKTWADAKIFPSQLKACQICWLVILYNMANDIPPPQYKDNRYKIRQNHFHRQSQCQACQNGVCFNQPKQMNYKTKRRYQ